MTQGELFDSFAQWAERKSSRESFEKVPLPFLKMAYGGLHDLDLNLAVAKVVAPPAEPVGRLVRHGWQVNAPRAAARSAELNANAQS